MIRIFISYSHADEALRQELDKHLASLKHQGIVEVWNDRRIGAGEEWAQAIDANLRNADVILLLVSTDFIASPYCYEIEMREVMRRHDAGEAVVIPIILRPCDWHDLPFAKLQTATQDGKPIVKYTSLDEGFLEVVQSIKNAAKRLGARNESAGAGLRNTIGSKHESAASPVIRPTPRSSNLHVRKKFTDHDRDKFRSEAFDYIAAFFENSLAELQARNPRLQARFRRRDANSFEAAVYENGKQAAKCGIWLGGGFAGDIAYSQAGLGHGNSYNESMSVADDGQLLGLQVFGLSDYSGTTKKQLLTLEGAAEYYWWMLMQPLQDG
jgi:hypothetical protein